MDTHKPWSCFKNIKSAGFCFGKTEAAKSVAADLEAVRVNDL